MRNLLKIYVILFISYNADSYPTESSNIHEEEESLSESTSSSTTFRTAQLLISPKQNARILEPSSSFILLPASSSLENSLSDNVNFKKISEESNDASTLSNETLIPTTVIEESTESDLSVIKTSLSDTHTESYNPSSSTTYYSEHPTEKLMSSLVTTSSEPRRNSSSSSIKDITTSPPLWNEMSIEESREMTLTPSQGSEDVSTYTTSFPMIYPELATESPQSDEEGLTTMSSSYISPIPTSTTTTTPATTKESSTIATPTPSSKYSTQSTSIPTSDIEYTSSTPPPVDKKKKDPLLYHYQNDAHWDISMDDMDFYDYQESIKEEKSRLNDIQLMDGGVKDSMTIVLTPIKYVSDAMVHIKYKRISKDPTEEMSKESDSSDPGRLEMSHDVSFPLLDEENKRNLENLPEGWYFVCAEVTKFDKMLEQECFRARIFEKASSGAPLPTGVIVLIVLGMILIVLLCLYIVYNKLQNSRRKKKDKEMQDRIQKMAQKEKELNERNKPAFHHIYVDPDEPYEERCIM